MTKQELLEAHRRLELFLGSLLPLTGRLERRRWGSFYVQGLLLEGGRKSAAQMAQRYGGDVQALQQFVNQSPWDWYPIRHRLALKMSDALGKDRPAWPLDDTGFPKKGEHSVGVARQYSGTLGKVANCQIGVSLNYATDDGCVPIDFELYLPEEWAWVPERRAKAGIPEEIKYRTKPEIALAMIDRAISWGVTPGVVCADAAYGNSGDFRAELVKRGLTYMLAVKGNTVVRTEEGQVQAVEELAAGLPSGAWAEVCWREGTKGKLKANFAALRVFPKHEEQALWLLVQAPQKEGEDWKYWFSNLPPQTSLLELVRYAKIRWWVEQNYQQLKDELGLDHFEGRSWTGWHHHVTLVMMAFDFLVLERLRSKKNFWVWFDPPASEGGDPDRPIAPLGLLPHMWDKDSWPYLT